MNLCLFRLINQFAGRWAALDALGVFLAAYFGYLLTFFLVGFILIDFRKYGKMVLSALASAILAKFLIVGIIRKLMPLTRPFVGRQVNLLIQYPASASFPSGHASFFFAIAFLLFFWLKKTERPPKHWKLTVTLFFISAFLIGTARIFAGLHWPADILGAIFVGLFSGWLAKKLSFNLLKNL